jgi:calcium-dependent protein kinase
MGNHEVKLLFGEVEILKNLDHPNILKMYESYEDNKKYYIVTELCGGGELFDEIVGRSHFCESDAALVMKSLLSCVNHCHSKNIMHRDLKPENIMLEENKDYNQIKIIDFGTATYFERGKPHKLRVGTPYYIAPEVLNGNYTEKCDVWSCGIIAYILLSGKPPFNGKDDAKIFEKIKSGKFSMDGKTWGSVSA